MRRLGPLSRRVRIHSTYGTNPYSSIPDRTAVQAQGTRRQSTLYGDATLNLWARLSPGPFE